MTVTEKPAVLGGTPAFDATIPITQPTLPAWDALEPQLRRMYESGMITNSSSVKELESAAAAMLNVKHVVAVGSCTAGLMLSWKARVISSGEVILPSFTFSASGHALLWNGLTPRFVDIEPDTLLPSPEMVEAAITERTVGILGVHTFGNPAYPIALEEIARRHGIPLVFDSAHALGGSFEGRPIGGFGNVEVFSLSPTKLVVAGEGGLVATNDAELARRVRIGRDYGNPGNYDTEFAGLNARMSEFHAILTHETLRALPENFRNRRLLVDLYTERLENVPGLSFQTIAAGGESTFKDMAILIDADAFGLSRDQLVRALGAEGVMTRNYYDPPLHRQQAYGPYAAEYGGVLPVTEAVSKSVTSIPLASHYTPEDISRVCEAIIRIQEHSTEVARELR